MLSENRNFKDETIKFDENEFINCTFTNCSFAYSGDTVAFQNISMHGTFDLLLTGPAARTMEVLQYISKIPAIRKFIVERMLDNKDVSYKIS
jgi:hypothetical protein